MAFSVFSSGPGLLIPHLTPAPLPALTWDITDVTALSVAFVLVEVELLSGGF